MTKNLLRWMGRIAIGVVTVTLPVSLTARELGTEIFWECGPLPEHDGPARTAMAGFNKGPMGPALPFRPMHGVAPSEEQEDKVFQLLVAHAPAERAAAREAEKQLQEMRRLVDGDSFDPEKARTPAQTYAQSTAKLLVMQAELNAKVRGWMRPEQRSQADAMGCHPGRCGGKQS